MNYKITGNNFHLSNVLDMLRYCTGKLLIIKTKNRINGKSKHIINFIPKYYKSGDMINTFYDELIHKKLIDIIDSKIEYIIVDSKNISEERWNSFGYYVDIK